MQIQNKEKRVVSFIDDEVNFSSDDSDDLDDVRLLMSNLFRMMCDY